MPTSDGALACDQTPTDHASPPDHDAPPEERHRTRSRRPLDRPPEVVVDDHPTGSRRPPPAAPSLWRNRGFRRLPAVAGADPAAFDVTVPAGGDDGA